MTNHQNRTGLSRELHLVLLAALFGCATTPSQSVRPFTTDIACDSLNLPEPKYGDGFKRPGDRFSYQEYAEQTYLYAQLADNAYPQPFPWTLPDSVRLVESVEHPPTGFAARVYEFGPRGAPSRIMIAYRGTEGPLLFSRDWRKGNWTTQQHPHAEALYDRLRKGYPDSIPIHATGHSLGGALALQVSITHDHASAFVFNTSYRVKRRPPEKKSHRISIAERGEILTPVRVLLPNMTLLHLPGFNCTRGGPIDNHGMTGLARCLTRVAALRDSSAARSLRQNMLICPIRMASRSGATSDARTSNLSGYRQ